MSDSGLKLHGEPTERVGSENGWPNRVVPRSLVCFVRHPDSPAFIIGSVVGLAICGPLLGGDRVFLLDWSIGPHAAVVTSGTLGLNGGLTTGVIGSGAEALLNHFIGGVATWLPILLFFPIASVGVARLTGRSRWSRLAAGLLYSVNPFVFNRIYAGQISLLIGYALLPFAVVAAIRSSSSKVSRWPVAALWWAVLTALSPHFAWIFGLVVLGLVVVSIATRQHRIRRISGWLFANLGAFFLMSAYIILPHSATNLPTTVGRASLAIYRTVGDPHLGLFLNVLGLYGFWRTGPGPELPKQLLSGWAFLMLGIAIVSGVGAWYALTNGESRRRTSTVKSDSEGLSNFLERGDSTCLCNTSNASYSQKDAERRLAMVLLFVGTVGYFLALGDQGPTGWLFTWSYEHVPFFSIMREPQKFLMLLALAYAVLFGWGVEQLIQINFHRRGFGAFSASAVLAVALPLGYTPTIFNGLNGQIGSSVLPASYQKVSSLVSKGSGNVLYLPWHLYMAYGFTNGRVIANVASSSFSQNVISGDNVEAGGVETQSTSPRSEYLQKLFENGNVISDFGALVAPLGVQDVVLAKTVDWKSYRWLGDQADLKLIFNSSSLEVWRNLAYAGVGQRVKKITFVAGLAGIVRLARIHELGDGAVKFNRDLDASPETSDDPQGPPANGTTTSNGLVTQLSPVAYRISPGTAGWVEVDAPFQLGWSLDGHSATESAEGTVLVRAGTSGGVLFFNPWSLVRLGYLLSFGTFAALMGILLLGRRQTEDQSNSIQQS